MKILFYYDDRVDHPSVERDIGYYYLNEDGVLMNYWIWIDVNGGVDGGNSDMVISNEIIKSITSGDKSGHNRDHEISKEQYERITTRLLL